MPKFINKYVHIINQEANILLDNKFQPLNPTQHHMIQAILKHTDELLIAATNSKTRHELLNLMTPIAGYIDMLSDGWMGEFNSHQRDQIKLISVAVQRLTEYIRSYSHNNQHIALR